MTESHDLKPADWVLSDAGHALLEQRCDATFAQLLGVISPHANGAALTAAVRQYRVIILAALQGVIEDVTWTTGALILDAYERA
jgi:hypothetical protein